MARERNSDHKCRSDSGASFYSRSDERLSLDSEERKAVPLHKREIWFINMMNGNQVKFLWGRHTGIIPRSTPRLRISDEYKSSLSPFLFDHPLQWFLRVFFRAKEKMKPGPRYSVLLLERARFITSFSRSSDSSFTVYHFTSQLSGTFAWFPNFRVPCARGIARTLLGQSSGPRWTRATNGARYQDRNWFRTMSRISRARPRQVSSRSLTNRTAVVDNKS